MGARATPGHKDSSALSIVWRERSVLLKAAAKERDGAPQKPEAWCSLACGLGFAMFLSATGIPVQEFSAPTLIKLSAAPLLLGLLGLVRRKEGRTVGEERYLQVYTLPGHRRCFLICDELRCADWTPAGCCCCCHGG
ncbi:hypothetical protein K456DRAFT_28428 [Colletotrichum gloeosporioides 23]|nr:hypothetical protein K456DRAFT_28428 [Colletotrichum gloeosporioides 23]